MDISAFTNITSPIFSTDSGNYINFTCDIAGVGKGIQFTASDTDVEEYGHQLYVNAVNGAYGPVAPFIQVVEPTVNILTVNKAKQDSLLEKAALLAFPLQSAKDLGIATAEQEEKLIKIKQYASDLINVPLNQSPIVWPKSPN